MKTETPKKSDDEIATKYIAIILIVLIVIIPFGLLITTWGTVINKQYLGSLSPEERLEIKEQEIAKEKEWEKEREAQYKDWGEFLTSPILFGACGFLLGYLFKGSRRGYW